MSPFPHPTVVTERRDDYFYTELSRANNELANLQRELARKNAELTLAQTELQALNADLEQRVEQRTAALQAATLEAERANRAKSEFLSRMSHELRTPMNAVLGFAQVLEGEEDLSGDQRESVAQILQGGSHLLKLINEVLDISGIESGRMALSSEPVALAGLLEECLQLLGPLTASAGVRISVQPDKALGLSVKADRQRLKQVLLNLLSNAIKYNRPGGDVTIAATAREASEDGAFPTIIRLSVTDTGAGLSPEKLGRLFQAFDRLGAEQTRIEGTGLGLALAKRMVEHMGGTLGVESKVGVGSTFWFELPFAEALAKAEEHALPEAPRTQRTLPAEKRVLLYIEDNPSNIRLITRILARRPEVKLLCAETGALGLKMACEHRPDLILLDLHLPDSHDGEVLTELRHHPCTAEIPVILLTADAQPATRERLLAAGARAFATKPLEVRGLLRVIDQFLNPTPT